MLLVTDRKLLEGYREGCPKAYERIFDHYAERVTEWLRRGFRFQSKGTFSRFFGFDSADQIHDATHEIFLKVFEERTRLAYSGIKPFEGYLFVITRNTVIRRIRHANGRKWVQELDRLSDENPSPDEVIESREAQQEVVTFLKTLSEDERSLVSLRFEENKSQEAAGKHLGWSRKKVRRAEDSIRRRMVRFLRRARTTFELNEVYSDGAL